MDVWVNHFAFNPFSQVDKACSWQIHMDQDRIGDTWPSIPNDPLGQQAAVVDDAT